MRNSWDLLIDINSKYLDYSKIMAKLIVQALEFHSIKNVGIKFSGSKGFHLIIPWKAFPEKVNGMETKKMFPDWARVVSMYIHEFVKPKLIEKISELTSEKTSKYITGDEKAGDSAEKVAPDIVLVSSRHLFRVPYSLHEKTGLASIVITKQELENFQPNDADPLKVKIRNYMPKSKEGEARELLIQALDWYKEKIQNETKTNKTGKVYKEIEIDRSKIVYPPCIQCMLKGLKDGKKRSLFIMISYLNSLNFSRQEIEEKITEWNAKNTPPLKQGYVDSQLSYAFKHKKIMPPNCDKYYKDINICRPDALCQKIKILLIIHYALKGNFLQITTENQKTMYKNLFFGCSEMWLILHF